jgi:glycosyltransferase involved in cell wall biosynthesis
MNQPGITDHGRLSKEELRRLRQQCGIWAYPTDFTEINCISALECQADGVVPATLAYAALKEIIGSGIAVAGDILEKETRDLYLRELLSLMGDEKRWKEEQKKGKRFVKDYTWDKVVKAWLHEFIQKDKEALVSIITPTIRRGWWNIMAHNIANQTYKNIEWIIVDDYPKNREALAKEYAKKYGLNIRYLRSKKRKVKRTYGLVNAENTGWMAAKGEMIVMLQDFMLMPIDGVEQIMYTAKKFPNSLIATVDTLFAPKEKPDITKEDWFDGDVYPMGKFITQNVRIQNQGIRSTNNPMDFEHNYGAVPKKIVDDLGGWYEFFDEGLGFDNTEFAFRALAKGYEIIIDENNCAVGIDHSKALRGTPEYGLGRDENLNDPRYAFMVQAIKDGKLPLKATQEISDQLDLQYTMPKEVVPLEWVRDNAVEIANKWIKSLQLK